MFSEGREDVKDEERAGRPSTSATDEKINEVEKIILANRRITVREVAEDLNISIGSCHSIFINDLAMRRVAAKFVPKLLNCDQKQHRMNIANEMLDSVRDDPNLLQRVITGDEAWVHGYDVETKAQSSQWKLPHEPRPKKARQVRSNVKVLLTVFFDCRDVVHHEFLPQGRTVNNITWSGLAFATLYRGDSVNTYAEQTENMQIIPLIDLHIPGLKLATMTTSDLCRGKKSATDGHRLLCEAYGKHALSIKSCEYWFRRFKSGDFDTRDKERGGRPIKFEDAELEALLDEDSSQTQEELAETLGVTQQAISNRLKVMGMVQKQGNWVPYELKPGNIERHICTCELLLKRQNRKGFLHRIVTGDEKWIHYDNPKRRKSWVKPGHASTSTAKPNIHGKKLMLCIWWDHLGVIYYELLQPNETITGERYQQQLMRLSRALKIKRPLYAKRHDKVIYQHFNARPHVAKVAEETLEALQWDVLPHPLYSPDIAPSDYHMFRSMTHGLAEQHFTSYEEAKNWIAEDQRWAVFQKEMWRQATSFAWKNLTDPLVRRQFGKLSGLGNVVLPEDKFAKFLRIAAKMEDIYSQAKVDNLSLDPAIHPVYLHSLILFLAYLTRIFASSRNADDLKKYWVGWRDATGKKIRSQYVRFVELSNEAARAIGKSGDCPTSLTLTGPTVRRLQRQRRTVARALRVSHLRGRHGRAVGDPSAVLPRDARLRPHEAGEALRRGGGQDGRPHPGAPASEGSVQNVTAIQMFKISEDFFTSLGMKRMTPEFWHYSELEKLEDRAMVCHPSAWDMCADDDFRIKQCTVPTQEDLVTVHHEMGHIQYYQQYADQPDAFREGANPGFHEAIGDVLALSVVTPKHLHKIGFLDKVENGTAQYNNVGKFSQDYMLIVHRGRDQPSDVHGAGEDCLPAVRLPHRPVALGRLPRERRQPQRPVVAAAAAAPGAVSPPAPLRDRLRPRSEVPRARQHPIRPLILQFYSAIPAARGAVPRGRPCGPAAHLRHLWLARGWRQAGRAAEAGQLLAVAGCPGQDDWRLGHAGRQAAAELLCPTPAAHPGQPGQLHRRLDQRRPQHLSLDS
ncbi:SETMAR, partial [Cordylochernes scorpioides]